MDFDKLNNISDNNQRYLEAFKILQGYPRDNPPSLSDIYIDHNNGTQSMLMALANQQTQSLQNGGQPFVWHIQVLKDEWGNELQPGDVVKREIPINRKTIDGRPISGRELNKARVNGSFNSRFLDIREYKVDEKGCIACNFQDAGYFIQNWGINFVTRFAVCNKPELSSKPVGAPNGNKLHVHYWRFAEVTLEQYKNLPKLDVAKDPKEKRGVKSSES